MALTAKEIYDLNNENVAAQNVALGTTLSAILSGTVAGGVVRGSYTAVSGDDVNNYMQIASGLAAIAGWMVQVYRAGVNVMADAVVTVQSTTSLRVADGGATYVVTAGDVLKYMIW